MVQVRRPGLSYTQKNELWRRWKEGQSLTEIGRALERHNSTMNRPGFDGDSVSTERWADVSTEEVFTGVAGASGPARF